MKKRETIVRLAFIGRRSDDEAALARAAHQRVDGGNIRLQLHDGRFVFEDQEPGTVSLSAVASGYREARRDNVEIPRGEDLTGLEIPLPAGSILEGRVLGADGRPALGAPWASSRARKDSAA